MTRSNRVLNRAIIAFVGLVVIAFAAWEYDLAQQVVPIREPGTPTVQAYWVAAAVCLFVVVLALAWVLSRGRGRTRTLVHDADESGAASVSARVAADLITEDVDRIADVVSVTARAFRVRGSVALELRVTTRPGADLRLVVDGIGRAVLAFDAALERRIPVLLHVAAGVRATHSRDQRVR